MPIKANKGLTRHSYSINLIFKEMAVNRHKSKTSIVSGKHTDFPLWLFLSVAIHLIPAILFFLTSRIPQRVLRPPVYQVELLTRPETVKTEEAPKIEEVVPSEKPKVEHKAKVEVKVKVKDIKHKATKKTRKAPVIPKHKEDAARPDDAIKKMREKVAAEDAVDRIRKKVREKETASSGAIKVAAKAPAKVYHYEELDAEMSLYYDKIKRLITEKWSVPPYLSNKGYIARLAIHIRKDGTIESMWMEKASVNGRYDDQVFKVINKVGGLPPLPKGWKGDSIDLGLEFE